MLYKTYKVEYKPWDFINYLDETNICEAIVEKKDGKLTLFTIILIINEDIRYIGL